MVEDGANGGSGGEFESVFGASADVLQLPEKENLDLHGEGLSKGIKRGTRDGGGTAARLET